MNIIVCAKQVVDISEMKIDKSTNKPILSGLDKKVNEIDKNAVEEAIKIKDANGGKITVVTVGEADAKERMKELLAMGADEGILINPPENMDYAVLTTILAGAIKKIGSYDLILCGKQAIDSDNAMVAPAIAGNLNTAQAMFVRKVESYDSDRIVVQRTTEDGYDTCELALPAVLSVVKEINEPRLPSLKGKMKAKKAKIPHWTATDLGTDAAMLGNSSGTKIDKAKNPPPRPEGEIITGETPEEIADKLFQKLRENQVI